METIRVLALLLGGAIVLCVLLHVLFRLDDRLMRWLDKAIASGVFRFRNRR